MKNWNWRYALGEVLLIFLGITLAITFQNWNEKSNSKELEQRVLKQLKIALQNDLKDVQANIRTHQNGASSCLNLLQALEAEAPINGMQLIQKSTQAIDFTFLVSDVSTYEYLKSEGLHIISNDSLRNQITRLYDVAYEKIYGVEGNSKDLLHDAVSSLRKYYTGTSKFFAPLPNIQQAKSDHELKFNLRFLSFSHQVMIRKYQQQVLPELQQAIAMVDAALGNETSEEEAMEELISDKPAG